MDKSSYDQSEEMASELYLNERVKSGHAEMGEKLQGT